MSSATSEEAMSSSADEEFQFLINEKTTDLKTVMAKKKKGRKPSTTCTLLTLADLVIFGLI